VTAAVPAPLALIVRQAPHAQRSARAQLDFALAAAAIETPLEIYFFGDGLWQLTATREPAAAMLPSGLRGWGAIAEMTRVRFFAEPRLCERVSALGQETVVPLEPLECADMHRRWAGCMQVISL
jgi:sulfur relay (sulfurtransferase) DsrF/TusC family protein